MQKLKKQSQLHILQEKERDIELPSQDQAVEDQAVATKSLKERPL